MPSAEQRCDTVALAAARRPSFGPEAEREEWARIASQLFNAGLPASLWARACNWVPGAVARGVRALRQPRRAPRDSLLRQRHTNSISQRGFAFSST